MKINKYLAFGMLLSTLVVFSAFNSSKQIAISENDCCKYIQVYTGNISQYDHDDPIVDVLGINEFGPIVWTRSVAGWYFGKLEGAFPEGKTWVSIEGAPQLDTRCSIKRENDDVISIRTWDGIGFFDDDILRNTSFEIRVYYF